MCTDFGPDLLRFARLIPERVQKSECDIGRLSAYNNVCCTPGTQLVPGELNSSEIQLSTQQGNAKRLKLITLRLTVNTFISRVYFRPLKKGVVLPLAIVKNR